MKVFISYCQQNGGLDLAGQASGIIEANRRNHCWYYDRNKTPGADKYDEIKSQITGWCDCVVFICTTGSSTSLGQRDEIVFVREWRIPVIPIRIDGAQAPGSLSRDLYNYEDIRQNYFGEEFKTRIAQRLREILDRQRTLEKSVIVKVGVDGTGLRRL